MTQAPATPELVERLRTLWSRMGGVFSDKVDRMLAERQEAADALEAQQARIAELEGENEQLRLAVCGGEDAPGYASSLPLETILKVCADNHATARRDGQMAWNGDTATSWRSCAEKAQALADRYEKALRPFVDALASFKAERWDDETKIAIELPTTKRVRPMSYVRVSDLLFARQALSSQGRREGGEVGLPELPCGVGPSDLTDPQSQHSYEEFGWFRDALARAGVITAESTKMLDQTHYGDPCTHCGEAHDAVPPGPCMGDPAKAKVIGYASLGVRPDGVEHFRYRLSTNAIREVHQHVSSHAPYYHFGRQEFGQPPPYDARLKTLPSPDNTNPKAGAPEHG